MVTRDTNGGPATNRPISLQEIATRLGVSRATVSNALQHRGRLSPALADRIRLTAEQLGYVPSAAARSLRTGRSALVGLVLPDFTMPLFPVFAQAFERAAKRRGMALLVADALGDGVVQAEEMRHLVARGADALVVIPARGAALDVSGLPVPVVVVDSAANPFNTASSDHRAGGRLVARHLADLGHRRVIVLGGRTRSNVALERVAGLVETFAALGVAARVVPVPADLDGSRDAVAALDLDGATAIACAYDAQAVGVLDALAGRGLRVPDDVSVTGFDDTVWSQIVRPALTTVRQDLAAIAEHALDVAAGTADAARLFPVTLVVRASTSRPPSTKGTP
jgi:LacI family transcriptional regulator